jgi:hypothetical protein
MEQKYNGMNLNITDSNGQGWTWLRSTAKKIDANIKERNDAIDEEVNKTLLHVDETIRGYNERLAAQNISTLEFRPDPQPKIFYPPFDNEIQKKIDASMRECEDDMAEYAARIKASETATTGGRKFDGGKLQYGLIPPLAQKAMVEILTFGAEKYEPDNWKHVPDSKRRYFDAAMRHLWDWKNGEQNDPESGKNHLAHAMCCLAFLYEHDVKYSVE